MKSTVDRPTGLRTLKRNSEPSEPHRLSFRLDILVSAFFLFQRHQKSRLASLVLVMSCPLFNAVGVGKTFFWACGWGLGLTQSWSEGCGLGQLAQQLLPLQQY